MRAEFAIGIIIVVALVSGIGFLFLSPSTMDSAGARTGADRYKEIVNPSGFVNADSITLGELVGKKVILVDFLTYSCINCQRTFPYLNAWYEKYKDQGLEIIGIHTPEFAFEKEIGNVRAAMARFGIKHPIVLDNEYATWNAYGNRYWPRKYLIDIHGNIVYDHIGEGAYEETERKIRELLEERARVLGGDTQLGEIAASSIPEGGNAARSPETYFGSLRNEHAGNFAPFRAGAIEGSLPEALLPNRLYLVGAWRIEKEYAESSANSSVAYRFSARFVYLVMEADEESDVEVWQDGEFVKTVRVRESMLYTVIENDTAGDHVLELRMPKSGVRLYAFTFG